MEELKAALMGALTATCDLNGLRLIPPHVTETQLEFAACMALMVLTEDWVKSERTKFIKNLGQLGMAEI